MYQLEAFYVIGFWNYMVQFTTIPVGGNGWDRMGLRWFRMANPAESVIPRRRHQFGVWSRGPGELDSLGDSLHEQRVWGSVQTYLDKMRISQKCFKFMKRDVRRDGEACPKIECWSNLKKRNTRANEVFFHIGIRAFKLYFFPQDTGYHVIFLRNHKKR